MELITEARKLKNSYEYDITACNILMTQDKFKEAEKILLNLWRTGERFETILYLSEVYYFERDMEKAIAFAKQAYTMNPDDELLLKHVARIPGFDLNVN